MGASTIADFGCEEVRVWVVLNNIRSALTGVQSVTYYLTAIDADNEVVPGFDGNIEVLVAEDLETIWRGVP